MRKKVVNISLVILALMLLIPTLNVKAAAKANTLAELRANLADLKKQKSNNTAEKNMTQKEIESARVSVMNKTNQIEVNQQKVTDATNESIKLEEEIANGKENLEKLLKAYQMAKGNNVYLEYIFDAKSYEDLVYRYAIIEQVMDYQEKQINSWKDKIEYNTQLKSDLAKKEVELNNQIDNLSQDIKKLGNRINELDDMYQDIDAEIKSVQSSINFYTSIGCKENENLNTCLSVSGDKIFRKPLKKGTITSKFGYRIHPISKTKKFHSGTDIGVSEGSNVYSIANGTVSKLTIKSSCGGNMIYIQHVVNGKKYTSTYMHLKTILVKIGDKVDSNTVIAYSGGGKSTAKKYGGYDTCTTGAHLHLSLATGWYEKDYFGYSNWRSHLIDPKETLKLPSSWSSR